MAYKKGTGSSDFYSFLIKLHVIELKLISYILFTLASIAFKIISSVNIYHATMVPFFLIFWACSIGAGRDEDYEYGIARINNMILYLLFEC